MSFLGNAKRAFTGRDYDDDREYDEEYEDYEDEYEDEKPRRGILSLFSRKRDEDYEDEYEEEEQPAVRRSSSYSSSYRDQSSSYSGTSSSYRSSAQRQLKSSFQPKSSGTELSILSPTTFDDSSKIVREVKENHITIFDMSGVPTVEEARRIVDYISGASEGMDCQFARICPSVFCLAPKGVVLNNKRPRY